MKQPIEIPAMGESISEVVVGHFLKPEGAVVKENEEIVEIETDKVNQLLYAPASGKLLWSVQPGQSCSIGSTIGFIDTSVQEDVSTKQLAKPVAPKEQTKTKVTDLSQSATSQPQSFAKGPLQKLRVSEQESIQQQLVHTQPEKAVSQPPSVEERRESLSPIRKTIARRLVQSLHQAAMLTTFNEVDMSAIIQLRQTHQEQFMKAYGVKLGFMSFFVQATLSALKAFPIFNAYLDNDEIVYRKAFNVGIAIATEKGLVVPVICHADTLSLHEIEKVIVDFAQKAKSGRIAISDLEGGGFTITNGGTYGSLLSTPILNPPQVGILGMHKIMERPIAVNGEVIIRPMMYLALSYDHRLIDGKEAVSFLVHIKQMLEQPAALLF